MARQRGLAVGAAVVGGLVGYAAERRLLRPWVRGDGDPHVLTARSGEGVPTVLDGPAGVRVAVESHGPASAPALVLVHGWATNRFFWHVQVAALADRYRVITYDQPGHGHSTAPPAGDAGLDLLGDTLLAVVEAMVPDSPVVVAGHSLGGMVVLNAARRHRGRFVDRLGGVALVSTAASLRRPGFDPGIRAAARLRRLLGRAAAVLGRRSVRGVVERLQPRPSDLSLLVARTVGAGPGAPVDIAAFGERQVLASGPDALVGLVEPVLGLDEEEGLAALATVPTVIVVGTHDRITPVALSRRMAARSHARLVELPRVGHLAPLEAAAELDGLLASLLDASAGEAG